MKCYLDVLLSGIDGVEQVLDVLMVFLCLSAAVRQQLLKQTLLQLKARLELLGHLVGPNGHLAEQNRSHFLQREQFC